MQPSEVAWKYLALARSVIPTGGGSTGKKPLIGSWKPYQHRLPLEGDVLRWAELKPTSWGMVAGPVSGITVIDCDTQDAAGIFTSHGLEPHITTPRGGCHFYFSAEDLASPRGSPVTRTLDGIDFEVRGEAHYCNFTGSTPNGQYETHQIALDGPSALYHLSDVGAELQRALKRIMGPAKIPKKIQAGPVCEGMRNVYLTSIAGKLRHIMTQEETKGVLMAVNLADCKPPLDWAEVSKICDSVRRYGCQREHVSIFPDSYVTALSRLKVSPSAHRVLVVILHKTVGFNKVKESIWRSQFEDATGIVGPNVSRAFRELAARNVIEVETNGKGREQGPSTFAVLDPDLWVMS
jgi:hypothetical protein